LEIIRSDTPLLFKKGLNIILDMILKDFDDSDIAKIAQKYIKEAKKLSPDQLASNIGINNINKYVDKEGNYKKGTPWHIKGYANYTKLLRTLNIQDKYPILHENTKAKVLYVKKNSFNVETISYNVWPKEFNKIGIIPDIDKMIDKFFIKKIDYLLTPEGKQGLLDRHNENLNIFF